jgi:adenosine kinase
LFSALKTAVEVGVDVKYEIHKDMSTGKCGAIIVGEDRSLVTDLGAAEHFTAQFLQEPEIWQLLEKARIFYIGGFIIPVSSDAVLRVAKSSNERSSFRNL